MKYLLILSWFMYLPIMGLAQETGNEHTQSSSDPSPTQEEENKAKIMRFYEETWTNDNYAFADEIFAPDYIRHDASDPMQGPGEAVLQSERAREVKEIIPDLRLEPDVVVAEEDMVVVRWNSRGNPVGVPAFMRRLVGKSGPVVATGVNIYRFRDGQVAEIWNNRDDLTITQEMGLFRLYAVGGFLAGVLGTLLSSWGFRRWRSTREEAESAGTM